MWVTRRVDAPAAHVWRVLIDTTMWPRRGPSIAEVEHDGRFVGPGSTGRVRPPVGPWLDFALTRFEEGHVWSWRVAGVNATSHRVESIDARHSRVGFELPTFAAPYLPVCALTLHNIARIARAAAR